MSADGQWTLFAAGVALASVLLLLVALTRPAPRAAPPLAALATAEIRPPTDIPAAAPPQPTALPATRTPAAATAPTLPPPTVPLPAAEPTLPPAPVAPDVPAAPVVPLAPTADLPGSAVASAPILMYHYVRWVDQASDPVGYGLSVTPDMFEQHMAALAQAGYRAVRMDTLARCMRGEPICPPQPLALTFDDGYADAFDAALPALQRHGFTATFYVVTDFVGQPGYMTWEQLAAMRDAGMEIGAHSISHPDLTTLDAAELARQVGGSKAIIEERLGVRVVSFCYPAGQHNAAVVEAVRAAGYESATTTRWDSDYSNILSLPRRRVAGGNTAEELGWIVAN